MTIFQYKFLDLATAAAARAKHPFPRMAACEAALESNFGHSGLAQEANNLFGMKQHVRPVFDTMALPTHEFENGQWIQVSANWVKYPDWDACFADRVATLERLSNAYPHYKAALATTDERSYITEVSVTWSTDPARAAKVLDVWEQYSEPPPASVIGSDGKAYPLDDPNIPG